jgi:hypothetical protein
MPSRDASVDFILFAFVEKNKTGHRSNETRQEKTQQDMAKKAKTRRGKTKEAE